MGVANTKATIVSNGDASPRVMNPAYLSHGRVREQIGMVEIAAADDNNSIYRAARVHSSWRLTDLQYKNDAITCGSDFNIGLYRTAADGGADVDENLYADAVSLASASAVWVDAMNEALDIDKLEKRIWEQLALTSDPNLWYDLALTGIAVGTGAGTVIVRVRYVDGT